MTGRENGTAWVTIGERLVSGRSSVVLCTGEAVSCWAPWRASAERSGIAWYESDARTAAFEGLGAWVHLFEGRTDGAGLAHRLRHGPTVDDDPGCPLLPDTRSASVAIHRWLARAKTPTVLAVRAIDEADEDCLDVLEYVARALDDAPVALLLHADGRAPSAQWNRSSAVLLDDPDLVYVEGDVPSRTPSAVRLRSDVNALDEGIARCRAGAVRTGMRILAKELAEARRPRSDADGDGFLTLAMAALSLGRFELVGPAVSHALALAPDENRRRLLRRIMMCALKGQDDTDSLPRLSEACLLEAARGDVSPVDRAWLWLDVALGCSRDDPHGIHFAVLNSIVDQPPGSASDQCRTAARLWLAAYFVVEGRSTEAVEHQRAGVAGLEALDDHARCLNARVRLGATLFGLGQLDEAAQHFELAAAEAFRAGDLVTAAECACFGSRARAALGDAERSEHLVSDSTRMGRHSWRTPRAQLLRIHARAVLALSQGDLAEASRLAEDLEVHARDVPVTGESWVIRLKSELAYLRSDLAAAHGRRDDARTWAELGLRLCSDAAPEERAGLTDNGRARLVSVEATATHPRDYG